MVLLGIIWGNEHFLTRKYLSTSGYYLPSKLWVLGSNPNGITTDNQEVRDFNEKIIR